MIIEVTQNDIDLAIAKYEAEGRSGECCPIAIALTRQIPPPEKCRYHVGGVSMPHGAVIRLRGLRSESFSLPEVARVFAREFDDSQGSKQTELPKPISFELPDFALPADN